MPVILPAALGGKAVAGILGMLIGATVFALGCRIFIDWVADDPDDGAPEPDGDAPPAIRRSLTIQPAPA